MNLLLAGFGPWDSHDRNPSGELAAEFGGVVLPVHWARSWTVLRRALERRRPGGLVLLGLSAADRVPRLERLALNQEYMPVGTWKRDGAIEPRGPWIREGTLPWEAIEGAWTRAGLPFRRSHHAGTFICNHVYYRALGAFRGPCGFLHLPPFRRMARGRQRELVRLALDAVQGARPSGRPRGPSREA